MKKIMTFRHAPGLLCAVLLALALWYFSGVRTDVFNFNGAIAANLPPSLSGAEPAFEWLAVCVEVLAVAFIFQAMLNEFLRALTFITAVHSMLLMQAIAGSCLMFCFVYSRLAGDIGFLQFYDPPTVRFADGIILGKWTLVYVLSQWLPFAFPPRAPWVMGLNAFSNCIVPLYLLAKLSDFYLSHKTVWTLYQQGALQLWTLLFWIDFALIIISFWFASRGYAVIEDEERRGIR